MKYWNGLIKRYFKEKPITRYNVAELSVDSGIRLVDIYAILIKEEMGNVGKLKYILTDLKRFYDMD